LPRESVPSLRCQLFLSEAPPLYALFSFSQGSKWFLCTLCDTMLSIFPPPVFDSLIFFFRKAPGFAQNVSPPERSDGVTPSTSPFEFSDQLPHVPDLWIRAQPTSLYVPSHFRRSLQLSFEEEFDLPYLTPDPDLARRRSF